MLLLYNIIQLLLIFLFAPLLLLALILSGKYRRWIPLRCGFGPERLVEKGKGAGPRFWIHALSVGETNSSRPLLLAIRKAWPEATIIFSVATRSGYETALSMADQVDLLLAFPFDLCWLVRKTILRLKPDLFILVETDFWPNFLHSLQEYKVPSLLVNGRISDKSIRLYRQLNWLFKPLFSSFVSIAMQTGADAEKILSLGVPPHKVKVLGNLKYDAVLEQESLPVSAFTQPGISWLPKGRIIWVAGSTHSGEEEFLFAAYNRVRALHPELYLVVAPRHVKRGNQIMTLAEKFGLHGTRRSRPMGGHGDFLLLDTMGELAGLYAVCDLVFIGGTLVPEGGHNPIEAASHGKAVLFGPHMEDFPEIADDLLNAGGAVQVGDEEQLFDRLSNWLDDELLRAEIGAQGAAVVANRRNVTARHLALIREILAKGEGHVWA